MPPKQLLQRLSFRYLWIHHGGQIRRPGDRAAPGRDSPAEDGALREEAGGGQDKDGLKLPQSKRRKGWEEAGTRMYEGQNTVKMKRNFQGNILFPFGR